MIHLLAAIASAFARHECGYRCGFRTHDLNQLAVHIHINHCGDTLPEGHH